MQRCVRIVPLIIVLLLGELLPVYSDRNSSADSILLRSQELTRASIASHVYSLGRHISGHSVRLPAELKVPSTTLKGISFAGEVSLPLLQDGDTYPESLEYAVFTSHGNTILANGTVSALSEDGARLVTLSIPLNDLELSVSGKSTVRAVVTGHVNGIKIRAEAMAKTITVPAYLSILPPIITLIAAVITGEVLVALLLGIFTGSTITVGGNLLSGLLRMFNVYWVQSFTQDNHASFLLFILLLGGLIAIVQKSGGALGLANVAKAVMRDRLSSQAVAWALCLLLFFDDYSCILIVGSSLRQVMVSNGISIEKFAFILHPMGTSLASMAPVSSWVGVQIAYVAAELTRLGLDWDPFVVTLQAVQYRFFNILMILFVPMVILLKKDFHPMIKFERAALLAKDLNVASDDTSQEEVPKKEGPLDPKPGRAHWANAVLPFTFAVVATVISMAVDGFDKIDQMPAGSRPERSLINALSNSDSVAGLVQGIAGAWLLSIVLVLTQKILTLSEVTNAWMIGMQEVLAPMVILLLAWALGAVVNDLSTGKYLASLVGSSVSVGWLPGVTMFVASLTAFAAGSAFGTMGILFPLISPIAYHLSHGDKTVLLMCFGAIMSGATFGNCCSPIADTSIITSMATKCSLQNHISTIMPYVMSVEFAALLFGHLAVGLGLYGPIIGYILAFFAMLLPLAVFGESVTKKTCPEEASILNRSSSQDLTDPERAYLLSSLVPSTENTTELAFAINSDQAGRKSLDI